MSIKPDLSTYEDFQSRVSDDCLLNGAYRTGIIGWEAHKMLSHAKEARHIFYGHPKSADPSPFVVLSVVENCVKYVLAEPYPSEIVDLDEYLVL
ncbi:MAG TPA: hypothetical protein VJ779_14455, partial [Acetobacteraceae bacterium]|nr:hypothetical protein [Acetobacteraceae bacterium]